MKKIISLVLVAVIVLTIFAGCSNGASQPKIITQENSTKEEWDAYKVKCMNELAAYKKNIGYNYMCQETKYNGYAEQAGWQVEINEDLLYQTAQDGKIIGKYEGESELKFGKKYLGYVVLSTGTPPEFGESVGIKKTFQTNKYDIISFSDISDNDERWKIHEFTITNYGLGEKPMTLQEVEEYLGYSKFISKKDNVFTCKTLKVHNQTDSYRDTIILDGRVKREEHYYLIEGKKILISELEYSMFGEVSFEIPEGK